VNTAIDELLAKQVIQEQMAAYCRAVDRLDRDLFCSVWHEDGTLDYGTPELQGRAVDCVEAFINNHRPFDRHVHLVSNARIQVVGSRAVSEANAHAVVRVVEETGALLRHYRGRYLDRWSQRAGLWALDHRRLLFEMMWVEEEVGGRIGGEASRDVSDPSYAHWASLEG
jgi:hypothetical protein